MAKKTKINSVRFPWRPVLKTAAVLSVVAACSVSLWLLARHVRGNLVTSDAPPAIRLAHQPAWMSPRLATKITSELTAPPRGAMEADVLRHINDQLAANPWVGKVRAVRRLYGRAPGDTIEVDCEFRTPAALVRWGDYAWLVDSQGVRLPENYTTAQLPRVTVAENGQMILRVISGVRRSPPEPGLTWEGDDLKAALALLGLLRGHDFTEPVAEIDASNFQGRIDLTAPHLILVTRYTPASRIYWGRPPNAPDAFVEVSPETKLSYLKRLQEQYGRIDAGEPWLDLRFDRIQKPAAEARAR